MNKFKLKTLVTVVTVVVFTLAFLVSPKPNFAQGMMGQFNNPSPSATSSTAQNETTGKAVWDQLQSKQVVCKDLTDDNFDVLGDYFMGQMMGNVHTTMNDTMTRMMGADGEKQMHITMGKRLSGCDTNAAFSQQATEFFPMMVMMGATNMMSNGWNGGRRFAGSLMGNYFGGVSWGYFGLWNILCIVTWILLIAFLVLGIVYYWKGINRRDKK